jgi:alpha-amylase
MVENGVMFQVFHWWTSNDGKLWAQLAERAETLASQGVTSVWIPPASKAADGPNDPGYAVYDLYDLGEFDQKGAKRTKYGEKHELVAAVKALRARKIRVYADMVFNQRCGADETEPVQAVVVNSDDRNQVDSEPVEIKAWTRFTFPGRAEVHSNMRWNASHFTAVDCNADAPDERKIYLLSGKSFSGDVSFENGNFDFLMGCDVDTYHPEVIEGLQHFGRWFVDTTDVDGFRLDALKHLPAAFIKDWLNAMRTHFSGRELFAVGEYWSADVNELHGYLTKVEGGTQLFDVPLHFRFLEASTQGESFDLTKIFEGSLVAENPLVAVTFVDNHDTQPGASLQSFIEPWFKPLAYALILLRREGYPCVFAADYFGHDDEHGSLVSHQVLLDAFLLARSQYNFGDQHDAFDHPSCIGWVRTGDAEHPGALVVLMSNGAAGSKRLGTTKPNAEFYDCTGHDGETIHTDEQGFAEFRCPGGSLSVWLQK